MIRKRLQAAAGTWIEVLLLLLVLAVTLVFGRPETDSIYGGF